MTTDAGAFDPLFRVNADKCIGCGACSADCPAEIIAMENRLPTVAEKDRQNCIGCQHCLAICPTAAVSVLGKDPAVSWQLDGALYDRRMLQTLVRGRRSVRKFKDEPVPKDVLLSLMTEMSYAPTGVNDRRRRFTVIDDRALMEEFREKAIGELARAAAEKRIPEALSWMADMADSWLKRGKDEVFRNAPHMITVSVPGDSLNSTVDCTIALAYFDVLAQGYGVGTVWAGLAYLILAHLAPNLREDLGIPADHTIGYCMLFGLPDLRYPRTVQREPEDLVLLSGRRRG